MPRKKVDKTAAGGEADPVVDQAEIDSYDLPKSIVTRLSKGAVPNDVKLQKDVPLAMIKGSTVFVNYLAALAHDSATDRNHKTITAQHVIDAVKELAWDDGTELSKHLKKELDGYRKAAAAKKAPPKPKAAAAAAASTSKAAPPAAAPSNGAASAVPMEVDSAPAPHLEAGEAEEEEARDAGEEEDDAEPYDEEAEYDSADFKDDDILEEPEEEREDVGLQEEDPGSDAE